MAINHTAAVTAISAILEGVFGEGHVFAGMKALPHGTGLAKFWYTGLGDAPEGRKTFGNAMVAERWQVAAFWALETEQISQAALEATVADADRAMRAAFRADSTLGNIVTDLEIEDSDSDQVRMLIGMSASGPYRHVEFLLKLIDLEGEAIAA